jgi:hypothetical protein
MCLVLLSLPKRCPSAWQPVHDIRRDDAPTRRVLRIRLILYHNKDETCRAVTDIGKVPIELETFRKFGGWIDAIRFPDGGHEPWDVPIIAPAPIPLNVGMPAAWRE